MADKPLHDILKEAAVKASQRTPAGLRALTPDDTDVEGLQDKQHNIDEYVSATQTPAPEKKAAGIPTIFPQDRITDSPAYGERSGEKLIDTREMRKPLGSIPSYDEGTKRVPEDQVALVHEGEAVVPADQNPYNADQDLIAENRPPENPSKEMQDARKKVENPGAQTATAQASQDQLIPSDEPHPAVTEAKNNALAKGDFIGAGKVALLDTTKVPKEFARSTAQPSIDLTGKGSPAPAVEPEQKSGMSTIPLSTAAQTMPVYGGPSKSTVHQGELVPQHELAQDERKFKLADYDTRIQNALDKGDSLTADSLERAKANYEKHNPWGSASNHPGFAGKLGHIAAKAANIAGDIISPGTMFLIPGTDLNKEFKARENFGRIKVDEQEATDKEKADADMLRAKAEKNKLPSDKYDFKEVTDNDPNSATHGKNIIVGVNKTDPTDVVRTGQLAQTPAEKSEHIPESEKHRANAERIVGDLSTKRYDVSPKNLDKTLAEARSNGDLTDQDYAAYKGYQAVNPNAATNLNVSVAGAEAKDRMRNASQYFAYTDDSGNIQLASGDKVPQGAEGVIPIKDVKAYISSAENTNIVRTSFDDLQKSNLKIFDDARARAVLDTVLDEGHADKLGLLVAGTGGQLTLPSGSGKLIDQILENKAIPAKLRDDVKDYIVNYYAAKDKLIALQMALQNDKMGRSAAPMLNAMFSQLPGAGTNGERMAKNSIGKLQNFLDAIQDRYPEEYGKYKKQHSTAGASSSAAAPSVPTGSTGVAPGNDGNFYYHDAKGNILGEAPKPKGQ